VVRSGKQNAFARATGTNVFRVARRAAARLLLLAGGGDIADQ